MTNYFWKPFWTRRQPLQILGSNDAKLDNAGIWHKEIQHYCYIITLPDQQLRNIHFLLQSLGFHIFILFYC